MAKELKWCDRKAFPYEEVKRQAECALWQAYPDKNRIAVKYPFVIGKDDYTNRLRFYVEYCKSGGVGISVFGVGRLDLSIAGLLY